MLTPEDMLYHLTELERVAIFWHDVGGHNGTLHECTVSMCKGTVESLSKMKKEVKSSLTPRTVIDSEELQHVIEEFGRKLTESQEPLGKDFEEVLHNNFYQLLVTDTKKVGDLMKHITIVDKRQKTLTYAKDINVGEVCLLEDEDGIKHAYMRIDPQDHSELFSEYEDGDSIPFVDIGKGTLVSFSVSGGRPVTPVEIRIELIITNEN